MQLVLVLEHTVLVRPEVLLLGGTLLVRPEALVQEMVRRWISWQVGRQLLTFLGMQELERLDSSVSGRFRSWGQRLLRVRMLMHLTPSLPLATPPPPPRRRTPPRWCRTRGRTCWTTSRHRRTGCWMWPTETTSMATMGRTWTGGSRWTLSGRRSGGASSRKRDANTTTPWDGLHIRC